MAKDESSDDFDPKKSIKKLSETIDQPDKFAEVFCSAARSQKIIDCVLKETMRDLMKSDSETRSMIKEMLREVESEDWRSFVRKAFGSIWSLSLIAFGAVLAAVLRWLIP